MRSNSKTTSKASGRHSASAMTGAASSSQQPTSSSASAAAASSSQPPASSHRHQQQQQPTQEFSQQPISTGANSMANQVQVRRPKAIVLDLLGTASKSGFLERILFPFLKANLQTYLNAHWQKKEFIKLFKMIQEHSLELNKQDASVPVVLGHATSSAKGSLLNFIAYVTDNSIVSPAVTQLRFKVWFEGYQQSKLLTPIYSDVPKRVRQWYAEGVRFYVFSNTWVEAQRELLRRTNHGDLTNLISGHFDNDFGLLTEPDSWRRLCNEIHLAPDDVLFLTKSPQEAKAAMDANVNVVLVLTHRHNVKAVAPEDRQLFPYVRTLNDLHWLEEAPGPAAAAGPDSGRGTA